MVFLPEKPFKVRADYLGNEYWSESFTWQNTSVDIPMAKAEVMVTNSGLPLEGIPVSVYSESTADLGMVKSTDQNGKALFLLTHRKVDAIVHLNPMFCCPGVVTASLFRKLQADFSLPIVDIFYDGTGDPNRVLIPHLAHLNARASAVAH